VELAHLLKQRLELPIIDRHDRAGDTPLYESYTHAPLVLAHEHATEVGQRLRRVIECLGRVVTERLPECSCTTHSRVR
jgi:hypothetical protein